MLGVSGKKITGTNAPFFDGSQVCAQVDPELFFPENSSDARIKLNVVKPICNSCEFKAPCLDYAVNNPEILGIWGGTLDTDRRNIRRRARQRTA